MKSFTPIKTKNGFLIDLSQKKLDSEDLARLSTFLTDEKCPKNLTVDLYQSGLENKEAIQLADILKTKKCQEGLTFLLDHNPNIGLAGFKAIADALPSCPKRFKLNLFGAKFFKSRRHNPPFTYESVAWNDKLDHVSRVFIDPIQSQKSKEWPEGFHLAVDQFIPLMEVMSEGIKKGSFPKDFKIEFNDFNPSDKNMHADETLLKSLQNSECPEGFGINQHFPPYKKSFSFFREKSFTIVDLLEKGKYPKNMHIDLTHHRSENWIINDLTCSSVPELIENQKLAAAIKSNQGPAWSLTIDADRPGWESIVQALKEAKTLTSLTVNRVAPEKAQALQEALKENKALKHLQINVMSSRKIFPRCF